GGASIGPVGDELRPLPTGDAGLQPELLADAIQPGRTSQNRGSASHYLGHGPSTFSVLGSQNCAPCRRCAGALQRSLRGEADHGAAHGPPACNRPEWTSVRASGVDGPPSLKIKTHKSLCTD